MEQVIFRIDKDIKKQLKVKAALNGLSLTELLGDLVVQYLEDKKEVA